MPQATEKTFTVEGLNEYVTSADTLSDSVLVSLQNQAEDVFKILRCAALFQRSDLQGA